MVQNEVDKEAFARRLVQAAEKAGYGGHGLGVALAGIFDVSPKAVSKWINAESMPRRGKIADIARVFGVDRQWLEYGLGTMEGGIEDIMSLPFVVNSGLSVESLRKAEEYIRFLQQQEQSNNQ